MDNQISRRELLRKIQIYSFAAVDHGLFLNTHPNCEEALCALQDALDKKAEAVDLYERAFGPLTLDSMQSSCGYDWIEHPWPWEKEA